MTRVRPASEALYPLAVLRSLSGKVATPREIRATLRRAGWPSVRVALYSGEPRSIPHEPGRANVTVRKVGRGKLTDDEPVKVVAVWGE